MREVSHHIRDAYLTAMSGLTLDTIPVPVSDELVVAPAEIRGAKVYVIVTDQQGIETTDNRCNQKVDELITVQIVAKFPKGRGGKLITELIADQILQVVNVHNSPLPIGVGRNALTRLDLSTSFIEHTDTSSIFSKELTFSNRLTGLN